MSGYGLVVKIRRIEETLAKMGMRWGYDKHGGSWSGTEFGDRVAVFPAENRLPVYSRDAQLFSGSIHELDTWLIGIQWARDYDMLMRVSDEKKRDRKEQDVLNKQLVQVLKDEEVILKG